MRTRFLVAFFGIVALGVGAVLAISLASPPVAVAASPTPPPLEIARVPQPVANPSPAVSVPVPVADPAPPPAAPGPAPLTAPVRAAPVAAPEFSGQLQSDDPEERGAAMLEMRQRRQAQTMEWLNRRRALRSP